jgi:hypothetical protein
LSLLFSSIYDRLRSAAASVSRAMISFCTSVAPS